MEIQRKRKLIILTAICLVLLLCIILGSLDCCFNLSNVAVANQTKSSQIGEVLLKNYETRPHRMPTKQLFDNLLAAALSPPTKA